VPPEKRKEKDTTVLKWDTFSGKGPRGWGTEPLSDHSGELNKGEKRGFPLIWGENTPEKNKIKDRKKRDEAGL